LGLPEILGVVSTAAIVAGLIFAGMQVRIAQRERSRESQILLFNNFLDPDFMRTMRTILDLPDGLTSADLDSRPDADRLAIYHWLGAMEGLGLLVFHRAIPLEIVDQAYAGPIIFSWRKLEPYVLAERAETGREPMHEWFQWLVERLIEFEAANPRVAAHVEHADWQA
jgi:hypothetical protein